MKKIKTKIRTIIVVAFLIIFAVSMFVSIRADYLEYKELGERYIQTFYTNQKFKILAFMGNFIFLYIIGYFCNKGIHKSLKAFFDDEKKKMPKLPNKSIALIAAILVSVFMSDIIVEKIILCISKVSFEIKDPIFNLDISYYMFIKPTLEMCVWYYIGILICISVYSILYHIIVFNIYLEGIDKELLRKSLIIKKLLRNILLIACGLAILNLFTAQNIVIDKFLDLDINGIKKELVGAGYTESTIKLWGYAIFSSVIIMAAFFIVKYLKEGKTKNVLFSFAAIPVYRVLLFLTLIIFDIIFVNSNELDKEKKYINYNIEFTKKAYGIDIEEENVKYSGTVTEKELKDNKDVIDNITIINSEAVLASLQDTQTENGYYTYNTVSLAECEVNGKKRLVYIVPKEIDTDNKTYDDKTYELTHGYGEIIVSATQMADDGTLEYLQKYIDEGIIEIKEPRIYYGMETNSAVVTNIKNQNEYDYTDKNGVDHTYSYLGNSGLNLGFVDRLVVAIDEGNFKLAFSNSVDKNSKLLINRNIIERAEKVLPYMMYDENPYSVIGTDGKIYWIIDAYTVSNKYPYSTRTTISYNGQDRQINYIRNSVKVIVDAFTGEMKFYITDTTDPLAIAYKKVYPEIFEEIGTEIPNVISSGIKYSQYLYDVQAKMISTYHNVKPDVLYRLNDVWEFSKYYSINATNQKEEDLTSYYTMIKKDNNETGLGLIQMYSQNGKSNIVSYLMATNEGENSKLKLYKFVSDKTIIGPVELEKQIKQNESISRELELLNQTGIKITKQMIIVPINNTLLYVEPIYQTMVNLSNTPVLKKVVVSSGGKIAIGNNLEDALKNLFLQSYTETNIDTSGNIDDIIDEIIKENKKLKESMDNNDWQMMGEDIDKLHSLINNLEIIKEKDKK